MTHLSQLYPHSPEDNQRPFQMQCLTPHQYFPLVVEMNHKIWAPVRDQKYFHNVFQYRLCRLIITRVSS